MSGFDKFKLLLWKNFILQKRHKWLTLSEILSPVAFSLLLIFTRCIIEPKSRPDNNYPPFKPTFVNISSQNMGELKETNMTWAFSPDNNLTRKITSEAMKIIAEGVADDNIEVMIYTMIEGLKIREPIGYKNSKEMVIALTQPKAMNQILVGIQYNDNMTNATEWPDNITVAIRFPAIMRTPMEEHPMAANWRTNLLFPLVPQSGSRDPDDKHGGKTPGYGPELFLAVQHALSQSIITEKTGKTINTKVFMQRLPHLASSEDPLLVILERFITIIITVGFAHTFLNTVRMVTAEKELQLKETMAIMGLPSWLHWLAWFIKQFSLLTLSAALMATMLKIPLKQTATGINYSVITFTPWSVLFFFIMLFIIVSITFSFMVSVFFSRANSAASFMGLIWFATYAVFMFTQLLYGQMSFTLKSFLSLISNAAIGYAFQMIVMCEGSGKGLQWGEFFAPISFEEQFRPGHVVIMIIFDSVLYMLIAMYVEKIRPGLYGVPQPWYFPFTTSFWMPYKSSTGDNDKQGIELGCMDALLSNTNTVRGEEPTGVAAGVVIQNLTKIYKGQKKAVDNLHLRMFENEITVLLGHNGAGKTTTISMLTGMIPPTSGSAWIGGHEVSRETEAARRSLGLCPQHNVLFPDLTVAEHIVFYSRLKGVPLDKIANEVNHFVSLLNLEDKRDVASEHLSGGQKRRLSVGAAMCGSSKVVLLDEPTSGLDPAARRALWDLLQKEKKGRTIILTTHFMDEAEVLGDRVAIMSGGRLSCVGSPHFLKRHYGIGYKISIVKSDKCHVDDVTQFFKSYVPAVKENSNVGSELTYILPHDDVSKFPDMLREFEAKKEALHVSSYGLSVTDLEEVFMKVGAENEPETKCNRFNKHPDTHDMVFDEIDAIKKVRGAKLLFNHVKAMFIKMGLNTIRNKMPSAIQLIWPVVNIIISITISRSWKFLMELPPLPLSLTSGFRSTETMLAQGANLTDGSLEARAMLAYKDYFKSSAHPGMTLTDIGHMNAGKFFVKAGGQDFSRANYEMLVGATFSKNNITAWFSNYGYHDSAISLALVDNAILSALSPGSSLNIVNSPLPYSVENMVSLMTTGGTMAFQFSFNLGFFLGFVSSFLVLFVIKERTSGAKLLQRVSGLRPVVMWTSAFVFDWLWMLLIYILVVITLAFLQETSMSTPEELGRAMLVFMTYSIAIIPLHYLAAFFFDEAASGFTKMCFVNTFGGCMPFLITEMLRLPQIGNPYFARILDYIFSLMPTYCVSRSLRDMSVTRYSMLACEALCGQLGLGVGCSRATICDLNVTMCCMDDDPYLRWEEPGIGRYLFTTVAVGVTAFTVLLVKEYELVNKVFYRSSLRAVPAAPADEDDDVRAERRKVTDLAAVDVGALSLVCRDLTKFYGSFLAVNRLTFGVSKGECFGLLGVNGAGKTSTFRMLTGDARISAGDALVHSYSVKTDVQDVYRHIGYCPQFDALLDNLSARETLHMFCLLRGIPAAVGDARAAQLADALGFRKHFDKKVRQCSGGTKRKISTAIALLGDAPLVFLDEPTTGMDPASKRLVWAAISAAVAAGRSVVLTSHSMEECEALCSRLTVMVSGRLYCLGPLQHLKTKFSQGYTIIVKTKMGPNRDADLAQIDRYITENFSDARLIESYMGYSTYCVGGAAAWWRVFHVLEAARARLPLDDYSVSQTTLEQVFLFFSRLNTEKE